MSVYFQYIEKHIYCILEFIFTLKYLQSSTANKARQSKTHKEYRDTHTYRETAFDSVSF